MGRRCLTKEDCHKLYPVAAGVGNSEKSVWKAFGKRCHYDCPNGFKEGTFLTKFSCVLTLDRFANFRLDPADPHRCVPCLGYCPKKCHGDEVVDSIGSALKYSKCNLVEGNLEVDMRIGMETLSPEKFTEAFGEIEEITG